MSREQIRNLADADKVSSANARIKEKRRQELNDLRTVLGNESGRRLVWRLLEECKTFGSVWENSAKIHYNAGRQDLGHFIMAEIVEADENLLFKLMKENKKGEKDE